MPNTASPSVVPCTCAIPQSSRTMVTRSACCCPRPMPEALLLCALHRTPTTEHVNTRKEPNQVVAVFICCTRLPNPTLPHSHSPPFPWQRLSFLSVVGVPILKKTTCDNGTCVCAHVHVAASTGPDDREEGSNGAATKTKTEP